MNKNLDIFFYLMIELLSLRLDIGESVASVMYGYLWLQFTWGFVLYMTDFLQILFLLYFWILALIIWCTFYTKMGQNDKLI